MKNIIPHNKIHKITYPCLVIIATSLHAHGGNPNMIWGFLILGFFVLLVISIILRLFIKNNLLIYISLFFIFLFFLIPSIKDIKKDFQIRSRHNFQEVNIYGIYEGNKTIIGTENKNIIYMSTPYRGIPNILDDNRTIYISNGDKFKHELHVSELNKVTYFKNDSGNIIMA